ncbi:MAG: aminotransferase class IV [Candidatus Krumholzibacteriota bacterium]|nr:aminotransferase class IV [Candidatus Krumholzibacteriota bacterium]
MDYKKEIVFLNGQYIGREKAWISPDDRGFVFSDGVYEVLSSYNGKVFEAWRHIQRLDGSLSGLNISGFDPADILEISERLIDANNLASLDSIIYIQVTRGAAPRSHAVDQAVMTPTVYACVKRFLRPLRKQKEGVGVILLDDERWARCNIKSVSLLPNILAKQKAADSGHEEAVLVRDGVITEGSASSFAAVFSGTLTTHPESNRILGSITRSVVIDLCKSAGIEVEERPIKKEELAYAEEMMIMSTTKEILPVTAYDSVIVSDGRPGKVTMRLQALLNDYIDDNCSKKA